MNGDNVQQSHKQELLSCDPDDSYLSAAFASCRAIDLNVFTCVVPKAIRLARRSSSCHKTTHMHSYRSWCRRRRLNFCFDRIDAPKKVPVWMSATAGRHRSSCYSLSLLSATIHFLQNYFQLKCSFPFQQFRNGVAFPALVPCINGPTTASKHTASAPQNIRTQIYVWKRMTLARHFYSSNVLACVTCSVPNLPNEKLALDRHQPNSE